MEDGLIDSRHVFSMDNVVDFGLGLDIIKNTVLTAKLACAFLTYIHLNLFLNFLGDGYNFHDIIEYFLESIRFLLFEIIFFLAPIIG